jgi:Flp pilus assembly protein TadG
MSWLVGKRQETAGAAPRRRFASLARLGRQIARLGLSERGSVAVEFALVATPFIISLFAFMEIGLVMFSQEELQTAATDSSRLIMTGIAKDDSLSGSAFQKTVCADLDKSFDCSQLYVNVQTFTSFTDVSTITPIKNGAVDTTKLNYNIGTAGDIVLVQVFYQLPVINAVLGSSLSNLTGNFRLIQANVVFRNEPF